MTQPAPPESENTSSPSQPVIEVRDLVKIYGNTRAVDGLSFSVARGEILGLLGPNGAGKSTTMRILTGYTTANSGSASIAGFDIKTDSMAARTRMGYLPESAPLYAEMDVKGYLKFMAEVKRVPRANRQASIDEAMEETNLTEVSRRMIRNLSKGFRQRVGLAQALLGNPAVLVLDEPTVGLDPQQIQEIRSVIRGMAGRRTVILSTHILPEVSMTCQKVIIINRGRIEAQGTPSHLTMKYGGGRLITAQIKGGESKVKPLLRGIKSVAKADVESSIGDNVLVWRIVPKGNDDPRAAIAAAIAGANLPLLELRSEELSLEDVFLRVISHERMEVA